mmetsp:Transcript_19977/g.48381  ORF Transcript_19977/g.48381 Transcript_19977/m.48381 type:complete len:254 (+) Transcript_19977:658-1419(+)
MALQASQQTKTTRIGWASHSRRGPPAPCTSSVPSWTRTTRFSASWVRRVGLISQSRPTKLVLQGQGGALLSTFQKKTRRGRCARTGASSSAWWCTCTSQSRRCRAGGRARSRDGVQLQRCVRRCTATTPFRLRFLLDRRAHQPAHDLPTRPINANSHLSPANIWCCSGLPSNRRPPSCRGFTAPAADAAQQFEQYRRFSFRQQRAAAAPLAGSYIVALPPQPPAPPSPCPSFLGDFSTPSPLSLHVRTNPRAR